MYTLDYDDAISYVRSHSANSEEESQFAIAPPSTAEYVDDLDDIPLATEPAIEYPYDVSSSPVSFETPDVMHNSSALINARVYAIGEKYEIWGLKALAKKVQRMCRQQLET